MRSAVRRAKSWTSAMAPVDRRWLTPAWEAQPISWTMLFVRVRLCKCVHLCVRRREERDSGGGVARLLEGDELRIRARRGVRGTLNAS